MFPNYIDNLLLIKYVSDSLITHFYNNIPTDYIKTKNEMKRLMNIVPFVEQQTEASTSNIVTSNFLKLEFKTENGKMKEDRNFLKI